MDDVWEKAFNKAVDVRRGFARLLGDSPDQIALASNTHELVVRFLSALPLAKRRKLITTDAEFHTIRRQLDRLAEEGVEVVKVVALPTATLAERLAVVVNDRTAAVLVSAVLYTNAHIVPNLAAVLTACQRVGAELLVDAYHALNVIPFSLKDQGLEGAYVVGGGYKYCQLGGGNAFLRIPADCALRPVVTGWFGEFTELAEPPAGGPVRYGPGAARFAGATYDPTSHYRAGAVFAFFEEQRLTAERLREVSQHQVGLLASAFDALSANPAVISRDRAVPLSALGGFLALRTPHAARVSAALKERGVWTDYRGDVLRLGPAPYLTDGQLTGAMAALGDALRRSL
ncbi:MAG TPA: aminotransferase class V-fold PLP-dependent enzyme [Gemmatimonadales bacterium]|nr:aminotransferase class V-fold PLP-dependent enzyme [Gemmatimonadales bacterium]